MLTKLRLYLADLELTALQRNIRAMEDDYAALRIKRQRLYVRLHFEQRQTRVTLGRDSVVLVAVVLMAVAGILIRGL